MTLFGKMDRHLRPDIICPICDKRNKVIVGDQKTCYSYCCNLKLMGPPNKIAKVCFIVGQFMITGNNEETLILTPDLNEIKVPKGIKNFHNLPESMLEILWESDKWLDVEKYRILI